MAYPNPTQPIIINVAQVSYPGTNDKLRRFCLVSDGDTTGVTKGQIKGVNSTDYAQTINKNTNKAQDFAKSFFISAPTKTLYVLEVNGASSISDKLKVVEGFIDAGKDSCYMFILPDSMLKDAYLGTMMTKYSTITSQTYFSGNLDALPATSAFFNSYCKGKKAFFAVYPNLQDPNLQSTGIISGIMASGNYDISIGNQLKPLERKKVTATPKELSTSDIDALAQAPASWIRTSSTGSNVIAGSRFCDGKLFSYWYAFDNVYSDLVLGLEALLENGSNAGSPIKYNDVGVKMLQAKTISILKTAQQKGLVDRFAERKDDATGELIGQDSVGYIPTAIYKEQNPQDYQSGVYGGLSAWVEIQGFIIQVVFNVNIQ